MELLKSYRRKIVLILSVGIAIALVTFGGSKLLVYFVIAISSLLIGYKAKGIKQLYDDYKLALRINTLAYSSKQTEVMQTENERLKKDLETASHRLAIYQNNQPRGGFTSGDNSSDRTSRFRENQ